MALYVVNKGAQPFVDRYDGKNYLFETNVPAEISEEAARHIFDYGLPDKSRCLVRQGLLKSSAQYDEAVKWLNNFVFHDYSVGVPTVEDLEDAGAPIARKKKGE